MSVSDMWHLVVVISSFFTCIFIVTFFVGYTEGKRQGKIQTLEERMHSQIVDAIRVDNSDMLKYYSKKDIKKAIEWGKRRGILIKVTWNHDPFEVIDGGNRNTQ